MKRVIYKQLYAVHGASSRIRCVRIFKFMNKTKYRSSAYRKQVKTDVFYIQQEANVNTIKIAKEFKLKKIPIVYDISDDFGISGNTLAKQMFGLASAITTNTSGNKEYFEKFTDTPIYVIPDSIDYFDERPTPIKIAKDIKNITTFGGCNVPPNTITYANVIPPKYQFNYIYGNRNPKIKKGNHIRWTLKKFIASLKNNTDLCMLIHDDTPRGNKKSNNKLLVAMALGIPTIVSNTQSYAETMKDIGLENLIVSSPEKMRTVLKQICDVNLRKVIQKRFIEYVWDKYHPKNSSNLLIRVFNSVIKN